MLPTSGCSQSSALYTRAVLGLHGVKIFGSVARAETCCEAQRESPAEADFGLGVLSQETIPPTADAHSCLLISSSTSKGEQGTHSGRGKLLGGDCYNVACSTL